MTSGCRGTPYFRKQDRELVLKPAISLKKSWGGYRSKTLTLQLSRPSTHSAVGAFFDAHYDRGALVLPFFFLRRVFHNLRDLNTSSSPKICFWRGGEGNAVIPRMKNLMAYAYATRILHKQFCVFETFLRISDSFGFRETKATVRGGYSVFRRSTGF